MDIQIERLGPGAEVAALQAARRLKSLQERNGREPSLPHLERFLAQDTNYLILAADGDSPVGFLTAYRVPDYFSDGMMVYLFEIEVLPAYRRQGIAKRMVQRLIDLCVADGVEDIWVGTENDNVAAKRLYASTGGMLESPDLCEFVYDLTAFPRG